jgi:hypothetical protein
MLSFVRSNSVVSRVIAGETLIIPVRRGVGDLASIYSLNPVASAVWQTIAKPCSMSEITDAIAHEFEGDRAQIEQDLQSFLSEMASAGLVDSVGVAA